MAHRLWLTGFVAVAISAAACTDDSVDPDDLVFPETTVASPSSSVATTSPSVTPPSTVPPTVIPRGGVVRLGVWGETDPEAETLTGAMIRSLTQPQLFVAGPDGLWNASLVEPGTDVDGEQFRSASFRLRDGAVWSDGSKIERDHLWDSADRRFVEGVDVADDGLYTISFIQPLPNWRHLWSGTAVVSPPKEGPLRRQMEGGVVRSGFGGGARSEREGVGRCPVSRRTQIGGRTRSRCDVRPVRGWPA